MRSLKTSNVWFDRLSLTSWSVFATLVFLGLLAPCLGQGIIHYVSVASRGPSPPYANWDTAASDIQSAVDVAVAGDTVLVTNGIYIFGGRAVFGTMTNRVAIDRPINVQSINGPEVTLIQGAHAPGSTNGDGAIRCVYMTNDAVLSGFTLTNGATHSSFAEDDHGQSGGGVWCESLGGIVSNCVLIGNSANVNGGGAYQGTFINCVLGGNEVQMQESFMGPHGTGGGAYSATLNHCTLTNNVAAATGGGAANSTLNDCTLAANRATDGGGTFSSVLSNCTLTENTVINNGGGAYSGTLNNCVLTGNTAGYYDAGGGGAYSALLNNCMLLNNRGSVGGGVGNSTLNHCRLGGNLAYYGGGAANSTLNDCFLATNSATVRWATREGGEPISLGGGAYLSTLNRCVLSDNLADLGGGAFISVMNNCFIRHNGAAGYQGGGGAYKGALTNCTLTANSAYRGFGGGAYEATLVNCIIYFNAAGLGDSNCSSCDLNYCCTTPLPFDGTGNFTNEPSFVDYGYIGGNLRLQSNSACINAGLNAAAPGTTDLDGRPRIIGGTVDIGAYEYQAAELNLFLAWLEQYGLPTDGSADFGDPDGDHQNNWQEWKAGTNPTNVQSVLKLLSIVPRRHTVAVSWQSVSNRVYFLERTTNLSAHTPFVAIATNISGQPDGTTYYDTRALGSGRFFYRVGVR